MPSYLPNLVLLQYVVCLLIANVGLLMLSRILWAVFVKKTETRLNIHLTLHCIGWMVFMLSSLPLVMYTLSFWKGRATLYHSNWMFWTGVFNMCTSSVLSIVTFFVIVDRCLQAGFPDSYNYKVRKGGLLVCILCTLTVWATVFFFMLSEGPFPKMTHCLSFGCMLTNEGGRAQFLVRIIFGFLNLATLLIFMLLVVRSDQKRGQQYAGAEITNVLARNVVVADLCTNFLLSVVTFSVDQWTTIELSDYLGAFVMTISSFDGLLTAVVYTRTLALTGSIRDKIKSVVEHTKDEFF
ncbi:unnamed protein product [Bursaphelenchus xylophilus]|uniref:(pine wood nematode) hypothetical protein n=1 Tax=Bursaphelenchus xylophilus TaxID=6326 RepID=A0A7I8X091_BURXY|nr:unnamed protein product [Bursaphelenchus xylophilus]CAG9129723.1 unnamed protein product [Bursaphelenchus xylophilus]